MNNIYFVYIYFNPINKKPFYVGMGKNSRHLDHLKDAMKDLKPKQGEHKLNTIRNLLMCGFTPIIQIIEHDISAEDAKELETFIISEIGRRSLGTGPLTNITSGGDGFHSRHSTETKQKISKNRSGKGIGRVGGMLGKSQSIFQRETISKILKDQPQSIKICPHCGKSGGNSMYRWHFNNCKFINLEPAG